MTLIGILHYKVEAIAIVTLVYFSTPRLSSIQTFVNICHNHGMIFWLGYQAPDYWIHICQPQSNSCSMIILLYHSSSQFIIVHHSLSQLIVYHSLSQFIHDHSPNPMDTMISRYFIPISMGYLYNLYGYFYWI